MAIEKILTYLDKNGVASVASQLRPSLAPPRAGLFDCGPLNVLSNRIDCAFNGCGKVVVGSIVGNEQNGARAMSI